MPTAIRKRTVAAAFLGCLSAGAGTAAAEAAPPPVTVAVAPVTTMAPGYRIEVRNGSGGPVDTTIRQELPAGAAPTSISDGGQAVPTGARGIATPGPGSTGGQGEPGITEVTWQLRLAPGSTTTLTTVLAMPTGAATLTAPACAFVAGADLPYDCASATWSAATGGSAGTATPWWRQPALFGGVPAALVVLAALTWVGRRLWQRRSKLRRAESRQRSGVAVYDPQAARGTLYPRPSAPRLVVSRRRPPVWLVIGVAVAILGGVTAGAVWTATAKVTAIRADKQPTSGAWVGTSAVGTVGVPVRESAFEFTVYRLACPPAGPVRTQQCQATIGLHNVTPQTQAWYGALQRAYQPGGTWVPADEAATRTANGGRDLFANPVPAGERMLFPLVFTMSRGEPPTQLELRSAVFSAGVRVNV